jgi:hypothetical protein
MEENNSGIFFYNDPTKSIYIVGDIHGDYQCLIHCLVDLCGVCKISKLEDDEFGYVNREYLEWTNSNCVIVFCGDLIHRKRFDDHVLDDECSDIYILKTLLRLQKNARESGGNIIIIAGNHEIMNLIQPNESVYTSKKNLIANTTYFSDKKFIKTFITNSYAWIKINDILIAHGGLCSDYLDYIKTTKYSGDNVIKFINDKYREFFSDFNYKKVQKDIIGYNLFIEYDMNNKSKHNMFWCREWGYDSVNCAEFKKILARVNCNKMIVAHCPQFLSPDKPKMINFECKNIDESKSDNIHEDSQFNLARIDLGMSRSFDYNKPDNFFYYLNNNYNRKMSVLKLEFVQNKLVFNKNGIITNKFSCIQYLLLKYGLKLSDWKKKHIQTDWIGFNYIDDVINKIIDTDPTQFSDVLSEIDSKCSVSSSQSKQKLRSNSHTINQKTIIMCILYPLVNMNVNKINSINQFNELIKLID